MNTVVVAANLGRLKAFRVAETPTRGHKLELIDEVAFPEGHGRFMDKVTDMAGRFSVSTGVGPGTGMSRGEALSAEQEIQRRLIKSVAERIQTDLETERPEGWYFAATAEIHQAILDELPPDLRGRIVRHIHADLTKVTPAEILSHVGPAWAA